MKHRQKRGLLLLTLLWLCLILPHSALGMGVMEFEEELPMDGSYLLWGIPWGVTQEEFCTQTAAVTQVEAQLQEHPNRLDGMYTMTNVEGLTLLGGSLKEVGLSFLGETYQSAHLLQEVRTLHQLSVQVLADLHAQLLAAFAQELGTAPQEVQVVVQVGPFPYALPKDPTAAMEEVAWALTQFHAVSLVYGKDNARLDTIIFSLPGEQAQLTVEVCFSAYASTVSASLPSDVTSLAELRQEMEAPLDGQQQEGPGVPLDILP